MPRYRASNVPWPATALPAAKVEYFKVLDFFSGLSAAMVGASERVLSQNYKFFPITVSVLSPSQTMEKLEERKKAILEVQRYVYCFLISLLETRNIFPLSFCVEAGLLILGCQGDEKRHLQQAVQNRTWFVIIFCYWTLHLQMQDERCL